MASGATRKTLRAWYVIDAENKVVGKIATRIATLITGKHKPTYSPHMDHGDNVVVINAEKVKFTGRNYTQKLYRWHTGYPGGLKSMTPKLISLRSRTGQKRLSSAQLKECFRKTGCARCARSDFMSSKALSTTWICQVSS